MLEIIGLGGLTALAFAIIMWKINLRFFAKYHWQSDILISVGLTVLFFGTFTGIAVALTAGIFISLFLWSARWALHF